MCSVRKLRIGVLMGGKSQEREVSFNSGRTVCDHIDTFRYEVVPLFQLANNTLYILPWYFLHRGKISDFEHRLPLEATGISWDELRDRVDLVYIAQHGKYGEDGRLQGFLELLQVPYIGSKIFASALGMDKYLQRHFLKAAGIQVPRSIVLYQEELDKHSSSITYPCVVKPIAEGSSLGVSVVTRAEELFEAVIKAATVTPGCSQQVIIEEFVEGMEFACILLTDYIQERLFALPPTEVVPEAALRYFDYEQKYMPGRAVKYTPARCTPQQLEQIQNTCILVMKTLGMTNIARIDGFLTPDNRIIIIDPNSFSGMDPASFAFLQAAQRDMTHAHLINHLIETELAVLNSTALMIKGETMTSTSKTPEKERLRVGVLMGGRSYEREISLASGRNVVYKLSPAKYQAIPLFVDSKLRLFKIDQRLLVHNSTQEIETALSDKTPLAWSALPELVDFAFIALHGGEGENGCMQGSLEMLGLPYNGSSVLTSALCMDKYKTNQLLRECGFTVPEGVLVSQQEWESNPTITLSCGYPYIVKPHNDGCSVGVQRVESYQELKSAVEAIFILGKSHVLIEECVRGIELTVGVIGNKKPYALPPSMSIARHAVLSIEEKFLPGSGENQTPAPLPHLTLKMIKDTMERAYAAINARGYARIDCFYQPAQVSPSGQERVVFLEVNTLPALTPATCIFHQASEVGLMPMDFIDLIVQLGFAEHTAYELNHDFLATLDEQETALSKSYEEEY